LEPTRLCPFHVFTNAPNLGRIHGVAGQRTLLQEIREMLTVKGSINDLRKPRLYLRMITIPNGLDEQIAQRAIGKL
jgi:hypothetical protein